MAIASQQTFLRLMVRLGISLAVSGLLMGCATGMSDRARSMVTYQGTFTALQQAPDQYKGQVVMLGGRILENQALAAGYELSVLQFPLDASQKPDLTQPSQGRFLVVAKELPDPAEFKPQIPMTVVGRVTGHMTRKIGEQPYDLVIVDPVELKRWSAWSGGVGISF
jgi:outer membrane lipoprotein